MLLIRVSDAGPLLGAYGGSVLVRVRVGHVRVVWLVRPVVLRYGLHIVVSTVIRSLRVGLGHKA